MHSAQLYSLRRQSRSEVENLKTTQLVNAQEQQELPCWIGGHFTSPYEQYTQQSPGLGFNSAPQFRQS